MKFSVELPVHISTTMRAAKQLSLVSLLFFTWVILASSPARADTIFNVNANITNGPYAGTDVITGTITINTATGQGDAIDLTVAGDPVGLPFTGILGGTCSSPSCVFPFDNLFQEYGDLILGNTVGYTGGSLGTGSYIYLLSTNGNPGGVAYDVTGSVTPAEVITPEPSSLILVLSGMSVLLFVWYRRRLLPGR